MATNTTTITTTTTATVVMGATNRRRRPRARRAPRFPRRAGWADMADGSTVLLPAWERVFPGRFAREMEELVAAGANPKVLDTALANGVLIVDLEWPTASGPVPLRAIYPGSFPYFRPAVYLQRRPFPNRHCNPVDGSLCLLGRNSGQWQPSLTLRMLLAEQLERALNGDPDEDPQGEPAEMWWNASALPGSYVLVDTGWNLGGADGGTLKLAYHVLPDGSEGPRIQAAVLEVRDLDGKVLGQLSSPPPAALNRRMTIPWARRREVLLPANPPLADADRLLLAGRSQFTDIGHGRRGQFAAIAYDSELQQGALGVGWLFPFRFGPLDAFKPQRQGKRTRGPTTALLKTLRAGRTDLGARIPHVAALETATVGVAGLGAIGSPVVTSLARNRCSVVHLLDYDDVEPGTTVRWARGANAWGLGKLEALSDLLDQDFPATRVVPHKHMIGVGGVGGKSDLQGLKAFVEACDIVVDACASYGVTQLLSELCHAAGKPLVTAYASPNVQGGAVVIYTPTGGCPVCLEYAWHKGEIRRPPGMQEVGTLSQPPGCAEATFLGADFEMQELSLQVMRAVRSLLGTPAPEASLVLTLSLIDDEEVPPPAWRRDMLPPHPDCGCRAAR